MKYKSFLKWISSYAPVTDIYKKHGSVREYSDDELYIELCRAEELPAVILSVICAEVLRRRIDSGE